MTKVCSKCKRELPADLTHYRRHSQTKDGLRNPCKECMGYEFSITKVKGKLTNRTGYKKCKGCLKEFPANEEYFRKESRNEDELTGKCNNCLKEDEKEHESRQKDYIQEYNKQYYQENKEFVNELNRRYYQDNKEMLSEYNKKYREKNIEQIKQYKSEYYQDNKEYVDKKNEEYRINNREKINAIQRNYNKKNKDKIREWNKNYCLKYPERVIKSRRKYRLNNLEKVRENARLYQHKRNAMKKKLPSTLTNEQWEDIKNIFDNKCAYCGKEEEKLTQDHFIPLIKGGGYTHSNIIPACLSCNSSKRDYNFFSWFPKQDFYSKIRERKILSFLEYTDKKQQLSIF